MKKSMVVGFALVMGAMSLSQAAVAESVTSLRGDSALDTSSVDTQIMRVQEDREPIQRDYVQQPPLIPHDTQGYKINLKFNKCLTCHSWANYKKAHATKISQTHFEDREGGVLASVAARRYFCDQCHVPQVDAPPLVENTFEPVQAITGR